MNSPSHRPPCRAWRRAAPALLVGLALAPAQAQPTDFDRVRLQAARLIAQLLEQGVLAPAKAESLLNEVTKSAPSGAPEAAAQAPVRSPAGGPVAAQDQLQVQPAVAVAVAAAAPAAPAAPAVKPGTVRVPYIPEFVRKELKDELRAELQAQAAREGWAGPGSVPDWVRRLEWDGDVRFRGQFDHFADGNAPQVSVVDTNRSRTLVLANVSEDRNRLRVRARLGLTATIDPAWSAGVRLTTGSATDPLSANQTLGNYQNRYTVLLDRAYLRYRYDDTANVVAGRFGNPWFGSDLVWANDLSFDGITAQWSPRLNDRLSGFLTLAALPVQEVELSASDKWLFGAQVGATLGGVAGGMGAKLALGYYHYQGLLGRTSPAGSTINEFTAPAFAQKGNTYYNIASDPTRPLLGLAAEYRLLNLTGQMDFAAIAGKRMVLSGDYVNNLGFDRGAVSQRVGTDVAAQTAGYQFRFLLGDTEVKRSGDWQVYTAYRRLERDAVPDAFSDSDLRLGGTNVKGYILGGSIGLARNTSLTVRYFSGDSLSGPPLSIDTAQIDLSTRF